MSSGRHGRTHFEAELWRLLSHARSCDGYKRNEDGKLAGCPTCNTIDRRLEDGAAYFADDPLFRMEVVGKALDFVTKQAMQISTALQSAPVQGSFRSAGVQLVEYLNRTQRLLTLPITDVPGYGKPEKRPHPIPEKEKPRRERRGLHLVAAPRPTRRAFVSKA